MNKPLFFLFLTFCSLSINAQQRSYESAEIVAADFISNVSTCKHKSLFSSREISSTKSEASQMRCSQQPFYIFSDSINNTYVIVSGDERMNEVLAYSVNGFWENKELPDALMALLEHYKVQYDALQNGEMHTLSKPLEIEVPDVSPLIISTWDQGAPYNDKCPDKMPSGCVSTAMSQVMNYHKFPTTGTGSFSYISRTNKLNCSYNFANATFDWDKIKTTYPSFGYSEERQEVADLTYACGVSVGMDYDYSGSGAYMSDVPYALINFFNYNKNVTYRSRSYYNSDEWYEILCNELEEGRPVIYGGVDQSMGGHAFIIDGCASKTKMFHLNWGWGGSYDGFYSLDALNPTQYKFKSNQDMVINISAEEVGMHDDVFYAEKFSSSPISLGKTVTFVLSEVYNFSNSSSYVVDYAKFKGRIGIGLFDENDNYIKSLDEDVLDELNNFYGYREIIFSVELISSLFSSSGEYRIAPYVIGEKSENPTRIRTLNGETDYIKIIVDEDDINSDGGGEDVPLVYPYFESFEKMIIPVGWSQSIMHGTANWGVNTIIFASEKKPAAADGASYAFLEYSNNTLNLNNNYATTWLITDYITLASDSAYNITFMSRVLSEGSGSGNILSLYYEDDGKWELLEQYDIENKDEWQEFTVRLFGVGRTRIAFEGNVTKRATLLLDKISISLSENPTRIVNDFIEKEIVSVFNIMGFELPVKGSIEETLASFPKGVYIIRFSDYSTTIVRR